MKNKYETQFTQVPFGLYRDREKYLILYPCLSIYEYLQTTVWRGNHTKDKFDLYHNYFKRGLIVASVPISIIARIHNMSRNTIRKRLKILEQQNFIKTEKIETTYKKDGKWTKGEQNVYLLGKMVNGMPVYMASLVKFCKHTDTIGL